VSDIVSAKMKSVVVSIAEQPSKNVLECKGAQDLAGRQRVELRPYHEDQSQGPSPQSVVFVVLGDSRPIALPDPITRRNGSLWAVAAGAFKWASREYLEVQPPATSPFAGERTKQFVLAVFQIDLGSVQTSLQGSVDSMT